MGTIDIWWGNALLPTPVWFAFAPETESQSASGCCRINNAASNAYKHKALFELSDADLVQIVETNVLGTMLGCKEVGVCRQQGHQSCGAACVGGFLTQRGAGNSQLHSHSILVALCCPCVSSSAGASTCLNSPCEDTCSAVGALAMGRVHLHGLCTS